LTPSIMAAEECADGEDGRRRRTRHRSPDSGARDLDGEEEGDHREHLHVDQPADDETVALLLPPAAPRAGPADRVSLRPDVLSFWL